MATDVVGFLRRTPRAATADLDCGEAGVEADVQALGVSTAAIPRKAKIPPARRAVEDR